MIKAPRTFERFIALLLLLSFAALFGAAYGVGPHVSSLGERGIEASSSAMLHHSVSHPTEPTSSEMDLAQTGLHGCCGGEPSDQDWDDVRCSIDCNFYLLSAVWAPGSSNPTLGDEETYSLDDHVRSGFLRPPIA